MPMLVKTVKYKHSTKFLCRTCRYPVMAVNDSRCEQGRVCSPCIEGTRTNKMDWAAWGRGMKKAAKQQLKGA